MSQYTVNDNTDYFSDADNVNVWNNYRCRRSVSTPGLDITPKARTASGTFQERHVEMPGNGLYKLRDSEWCGLNGEAENDNAVLFCYGDPGRQDFYQITRIILPWGNKKSRDDNSLVMDRPYD